MVGLVLVYGEITGRGVFFIDALYSQIACLAPGNINYILVKWASKREENYREYMQQNHCLSVDTTFVSPFCACL